jgi:hypothetical protein
MAWWKEERTKAKVVRVIDGDTIKVDIDGEIHSVRYIGIDTPETTKGKNEPGGQEATEANRRLVAGKTVYLEKDKSDTDRYGRLLRNVFTEDGTFVNAELVRSGHAEVFTYGADRRYESVLKRAAVESTAGTGGMGLPAPQPASIERTSVEGAIGKTPWWNRKLHMRKGYSSEQSYRGIYLSGSRWDDIVDILNTPLYAFGGVLARAGEMRTQNEASLQRGEHIPLLTVAKQTADIMFSGSVQGIKHRIQPSAVLGVKGFWAGMAVDVGMDPLTYTPIALFKVAKFGLKAAGSVGMKVATKVGVGPTVSTISRGLGEAFVPGYLTKQLPGKYAEYFDDYLDWVHRKRGAAAQAFHELKVMAKPYKRKGEAITKYIESGIDTGDAALNKYIDDVIKPAQELMRKAELERGIDVGEVAGYVHHVITKEGMKLIEKKGGIEEVWKYYAQKVRAPYAKERTLEGTIEEINKEFGFKFFEEDFWKATAKRSEKHIKDIYTADWFTHVQTKYGIDELEDAASAGIDFIKSKHPQISRLLPEPIAKQLDEMIESPPQGLGSGALRKYDKGMTWWKRAVTTGYGAAVHSAFFVRNVYGGMWQNFSRARMWNPMDYVTGVRARLGIGTFKTAERGKIGGAEMQDLLREQDIMGQPGMADLMLENVWERNWWEKLRDMPSWLMTETENFVRIPEFVKLAKTKSIRESRDITFETHFDYNPEAHTAFEKSVVKRIFPFWTWISRDVPFQIRQTLKHPGDLAGVGKFQQHLIKKYGMEEEYERRNEWQQNMFLLPNIFKRGEDKGWIGFGFPFTDLTTDLGDLYFAITPIKLIPELGYIQQDWGSPEYKSGKQKRAIRRAVEGRYGSTVRRLAKTEDPLDQAMYLAGMPTYAAAPEDIKTAFEAAKWRTPAPSKEQEYAAWVAAGAPDDFQIKILKAPPPGTRAPQKLPEPKWWEVWKGSPEQPPELEFELAVLSHEAYAASQGFKLTPEQEQYVFNVTEGERIERSSL